MKENGPEFNHNSIGIKRYVHIPIQQLHRAPRSAPGRHMFPSSTTRKAVPPQRPGVHPSCPFKSDANRRRRRVLEQPAADGPRSPATCAQTSPSAAIQWIKTNLQSSDNRRDVLRGAQKERGAVMVMKIAMLWMPGRQRQC